MQMLLAVIFVFLFGTICAYFAQGRGRDPAAWFLIGALIGVFGLILLFVLPALEMPENKQRQIPLAAHEVEAEIATQRWFYLDKEHSQQGPLPFEQLKVLWKEQAIHSQTFLWCKGMQNWKKIENLSYIQEKLND